MLTKSLCLPKPDRPGHIDLRSRYPSGGTRHILHLKYPVLGSSHGNFDALPPIQPRRWRKLEFDIFWIDDAVLYQEVNFVTVITCPKESHCIGWRWGTRIPTS